MGSAVVRFAGVALIMSACGPSEPPHSVASSDAGAGAAVSVDAAPPPRPFAGSPMEATQLIGAAIDSQAPAMKTCVAEYRARKKLPHERVEITVGIDQEGHLLGATLKGGNKDDPFSDCVQHALADAPFPRSHAGVIQSTKSYEEIRQ